MDNDVLGSCRFYPVGINGVSGELLLQESANGSTTVIGTVKGLLSSTNYAIVERQYGKSVDYIPRFGTSRMLSTMTNVLSEFSGVPVAFDTVLALAGAQSTISRSIAIIPISGIGEPLVDAVAQCEVGLAAPRSGSNFNAAQPASHMRAFCSLIPLNQGVRMGIRGGFIAAPTDTGIRVRGRVCNINATVGDKFAVFLHSYGDLLDGIGLGVGSVVADLGAVNIDHLMSGNFDVLDAVGISLSPQDDGNLMGRSLVIYDSENAGTT
jgi:hypothetical protein